MLFASGEKLDFSALPFR